MREELAARFPGVANYPKELAAIHLLLAMSDERTPGAGEHLNRALEIQEQLSAEKPGDPDLLFDLATTLHNLGRSDHFKGGRTDVAEGYYRRAIAIGDSLVKHHATRPQFLLHLAWDCQGLGYLLAENRRYDETRQLSERAFTIFEGLLGDYPDEPNFRRGLALALTLKAITIGLTGDRDEVERLVSRIECIEGGKRFAENLHMIAWHLVQREAPKSVPIAYAVDLAKRSRTHDPDSFAPHTCWAWHVTEPVSGTMRSPRSTKPTSSSTTRAWRSTASSWRWPTTVGVTSNRLVTGTTAPSPG